MSSNHTCDVAIVGGGLAGGLIALALHRAQPELKLLVVEAGAALGGNHVWSFFEGDVDAPGMELVAPFISHRWDDYEVRFPAHRRRLEMAYHSIRSDRFDAVLREALPESAILTGAPVTEVERDRVALEGGHEIAAGGVIDCRGPGDLSTLDCGWQKFVGVELALSAPHGLARPIIMDATVEQIDGYRFVYSLPLAERRIFVEDTYYSDGPDLELALIEQRCLDYAAAQGWQIDEIVHREKGVLPVVKPGGDFEAYWASGGDTAKAGARAGLFQPVTGYSLPDAVRAAQMVAEMSDLSGEALAGALHEHARQYWRNGRFYRMLDAMLFNGATTADRYKILERFYTLSPALISRFYAGKSSWTDKLRIVSGKPPIPVGRGIRALLTSTGRRVNA